MYICAYLTIDIFRVKMKKVFILVCALFIVVDLYSQQIIRSSLNSFGNTAVVNGVQYRQTVGQPSNTSVFSSKEVVLRQGFQQPVISTGANASKECSLNLSPNPTSDFVTLEFGEEIGEYQVSVFDLNGALVYRGESTADKTHKMDIRKMANGVYLLNVLSKTGYHCNQKLVIIL